MIVKAGGRGYVAGLFWQQRRRSVELFLDGLKGETRPGGKPWYVHWRGQTGFVDGPLSGSEAPGGLPCLGAALSEHIGSGGWMALVEGEGGRFAVLKAVDGAMLADGETVYTNRGEAVAAFEAAREVGWPVYATRGLVEDAVDLDVETLEPSLEMAMRAAPLADWTRRRSIGLGALAATVASALGVYGNREALWRWYDGPEEVGEVEEEPAEEVFVTAAVDGVRLVEGCRAALEARSMAVPGWERLEVRCEARLSDPGVKAQRPGLAERPVVVVRWRLEEPEAAAAWRRVAEAHLSGRWNAMSVNAVDAWAVEPLPPVLVLVTDGTVSRGFLGFREAVDRVWGARAEALEYGPAGPYGSRSVSIRTGMPVGWIGELVGRVGDLELMALSQPGDGGWVVEGRQRVPVRLSESQFEALTGEESHEG